MTMINSDKRTAKLKLPLRSALFLWLVRTLQFCSNIFAKILLFHPWQEKFSITNDCRRLTSFCLNLRSCCNVLFPQKNSLIDYNHGGRPYDLTEDFFSCFLYKWLKWIRHPPFFSSEKFLWFDWKEVNPVVKNQI